MKRNLYLSRQGLSYRSHQRRALPHREKAHPHLEG